MAIVVNRTFTNFYELTINVRNHSDGFLEQQFDLTRFSSGIYYLKINHENITEVRKLVKM